MGEVVTFGRRPAHTQGTIHVWQMEKGGYEIGQESESGNSWGSFDQFDTAQEAVAAAYRLNKEQYGGVCEIYISPPVLADLPITASPSREDF